MLEVAAGKQLKATVAECTPLVQQTQTNVLRVVEQVTPRIPPIGTTGRANLAPRLSTLAFKCTFNPLGMMHEL